MTHENGLTLKINRILHFISWTSPSLPLMKVASDSKQIVPAKTAPQEQSEQELFCLHMNRNYFVSTCT